MDPNAALAIIRESRAVINDSRSSEAEVTDALWAEHEGISALDSWLSTGGFLPRDWADVMH